MTSNMERAWLIAYLGEANFNATEAARIAGYRWPGKVGPAKTKKFAAEIKERLDEMTMTADEALMRLSRIARSPQGDCLTPAGLDMSRVVEEGLGDLVKTHRKTVNGVTVEFYPADRALETILKVNERLKNHLEVEVTIKNYSDVAELVYGDGDQANDAQADADSS